MIHVSIPVKNTAERRYAIDVLLGELLGLEYVVFTDPEARGYRLTLENAHVLEIDDSFFSRFEDGTSYLSAEQVPQAVEFLRVPFTPESDIPQIFGTGRFEVSPTLIRCGLDIVASTFFMLTRWEEVVSTVRDNHGRFPGNASLAGRIGFLHRPVVNEYAEMLWQMLSHLGCHQHRRARRFDWVLTHDVDQPWRWNGFSQLLRTVGGDLLKRHDLSLAYENVRSFVDVVGRGHRDPYDTFSDLMDISESIGVKSEFYFMSGGTAEADPGYELWDPRLLELLEEIGSRGHLVGFHPSYDTYDKPELWGEEFRALSRLVAEPIVKGRQHFLRFSVPTTWQIWEDFGMACDSTLGYADVAGFRCGICDAYPVFNILTRRQLRLREQPLIAMEGSFVNYQQLSPVRTKEAIQGLANTVRRYHGSMVMLWHNSSFNTPLWKPYEKIYNEVLAAP